MATGVWVGYRLCERLFIVMIRGGFGLGVCQLQCVLLADSNCPLETGPRQGKLRRPVGLSLAGNSLMTPHPEVHLGGSRSRNPLAASLPSGRFSGEMWHCGGHSEEIRSLRNGGD